MDKLFGKKYEDLIVELNCLKKLMKENKNEEATSRLDELIPRVEERFRILTISKILYPHLVWMATVGRINVLDKLRPSTPLKRNKVQRELISLREAAIDYQKILCANLDPDDVVLCIRSMENNDLEKTLYYHGALKATTLLEVFKDGNL